MQKLTNFLACATTCASSVAFASGSIEQEVITGDYLIIFWFTAAWYALYALLNLREG